jgi:hypothetical protein
LTFIDLHWNGSGRRVFDGRQRDGRMDGMGQKGPKGHSAASRNQIPLFPRRAQRRRERGEKTLAIRRDADRFQHRGQGASLLGGEAGRLAAALHISIHTVGMIAVKAKMSTYKSEKVMVLVSI